MISFHHSSIRQSQICGKPRQYVHSLRSGIWANSFSGYSVKHRHWINSINSCYATEWTMTVGHLSYCQSTSFCVNSTGSSSSVKFQPHSSILSDPHSPEISHFCPNPSLIYLLDFSTSPYSSNHHTRQETQVLSLTVFFEINWTRFLYLFSPSRFLVLFIADLHQLPSAFSRILLCIPRACNSYQCNSPFVFKYKSL
jgi:hypothetical protein